MATVTPRSISIVVLITALVGAVSLILFSTSAPAHDAKTTPAYGKQKAQWNPESVNETLQPGQTRTIPLSLTADKNFPSAVVVISPELLSYATVTPTTIGKTRKGASISLTLTLAVPIDALPVTATGTIALQKAKQIARADDSDYRDGDSDERDSDSDSGDEEEHYGSEKRKTFAKPLPITLNVRTFIDSQLGVSFNLPRSYLRVDPIAPNPSLGLGLGYTLATYESIVSSQTSESDEAPLLGCALNVGVEDNSTNLPLSDWLSARSYHRPDDVDQPLEVAGVFAVRRTGIGDIYGDPFVAVFVPRGDIVFTLSLDAHGDTEIQEQCHADFDQFLTSFSLME